MGAFYANITLVGAKADEVVEHLAGRRAAVVEPTPGYAIVYDSVCDEQETEAMADLAKILSKKTSAPAFALLVHDDDVMIYFVGDGGVIVDTYNSAPGYFAGPVQSPSLWDPEALCRLCQCEAVDEIVGILRSEKYVFQTERHLDLVHALGLPPQAVGGSLEQLSEGDFQSDIPSDSIRWAANPPEQESRQTKEDRRLVEGFGDEDASKPCRRDECDHGRISLSVLCRRHHFEMVTGRQYPF